MKSASSFRTTRKVRKSARGYQVVGTTRDGVKILRPKAKPKHFTSKQIRKTISEVEKTTSVRA